MATKSMMEKLFEHAYVIRALRLPELLSTYKETRVILLEIKEYLHSKPLPGLLALDHSGQQLSSQFWSSLLDEAQHFDYLDIEDSVLSFMKVHGKIELESNLNLSDWPDLIDVLHEVCITTLYVWAWLTIYLQ